MHEIVGEPTPGTRAYRREGTHAQCAEWFEALGEYYKGDVGLSTNGVVLFVPVSRAGVHKRIKEGKLTAFFFYITSEETTLFGAKRKAKQRPCIAVIPSSKHCTRRHGIKQHQDSIFITTRFMVPERTR